MTRVTFRAAAAALAFATLAAPALCADYAGPAAEPQGVPCSIGQPFWEPSNVDAQTLAEVHGWPSVYYGHFSGGRPYVDASGRRLVDWREEFVCFPTSRQCRDWVAASYATHHDPEGYRACLLLR